MAVDRLVIMRGLRRWFGVNGYVPTWVAVLGTVVSFVGIVAAWWPRTVVPSLEEAIALASNDRTAEALSLLEQLAVVEPQNPVVLANLCGVQLQLNRLVEARKSCVTALGLQPRNWLGNYNQTCLLALEGRLNEAVATMEVALAQVAQDTGARMTRADLAARALVDPMLEPVRHDLRFRKLIGTP